MVYGIVVGIIFGCYILSSVVLFKFPCLLHKRKNVRFICRHISHRGGAGENYENTMTAFKHAVSLETDMLELDVHLTKDEQVVVAHDPHLQRTTNAHGMIAETNYAELPGLRDVLPIDFMPGCFFSRPSEQDRQMPLLETVFKAFPDTPINIDIKVPNELLIVKVSELVKLYKREHLTVWGNFSDAITQRCYKQNPNICLLFSLRRVVLLVLQLYTGLLPFMPIKETHLEIFMPRHAYNLFMQRAPATEGADATSVPGSPLHPISKAVNLRKSESSSTSLTHSASLASLPAGTPPLPTKGPWYLRTIASFAHLLLIRPALFAHLAKRGIQTYLWVLNSEDEFHLGFKSGATGVMTDYPTKLRSFLADNPQYFLNYPDPKPQESSHGLELEEINHVTSSVSCAAIQSSATSEGRFSSRDILKSDSLGHFSSREHLSCSSQEHLSSHDFPPDQEMVLHCQASNREPQGTNSCCPEDCLRRSHDSLLVSDKSSPVLVQGENSQQTPVSS